MPEFDAAVVGAGPNGLTAAVELATSGLRTLLVEASDRVGGGTRTEELTLPGFRHDICSAIHPSGIASPFFDRIGLDVAWVHPPIPVAHPLEGGQVTALYRSIDETAAGLGEDAAAYTSLMYPFVERADEMIESSLDPVTLFPSHPLALIRLGLIGGLPASLLARRFSTTEGKALLAGLSAHSIAAFHQPLTAAVGVMLGAIGHSHGWPLAPGGSETIARALAQRFLASGGKVEVGRPVENVDELPASVVFLDVMPPAAHRLAGHRISARAARRLSRWRPGPGVFKVDWALDAPIPWTDPLSARAGTIHVGGSYPEVAAAERAVVRGDHPKRPFVLVAQPSMFDQTRAPHGKHTAWGYCHVPNGSQVDMTEVIESQIERFAPGFRDRVLARSTQTTKALQAYNPNNVGGDIGGGAYGLRKVLQIGRKAPYSLGNAVYLCSAATPPGAGVHGMCGYHAARAYLDELEA